MGLNLSNRQIALELGLSPSDVQAMTEHLRRGLVARAPAARLEGEVEVDEVYVVAGHKGQPAAVAKRGGSDAVAGWPACSRPRSSRSSRPRLPRARSSIPTSMASTPACPPGAISTKRSATGAA